MTITGTTRVYAHIGHPIGHVRAPALFNRLANERDIDAVMIPVEVAAGTLPSLVAGFRAWRNLVGVGVTIPHKETMTRLVDELTPMARLCGATNVIRRHEDGHLLGGQVDGIGLVKSLEQQGHLWPVLACCSRGRGHRPCSGVRPGRRRGGAPRGGQSHPGQGGEDRCRRARRLPRMRRGSPCRGTGVRHVINTTSLGMAANDPLPVNIEVLRPSVVVADAVMAPPETELLEAGGQRGCVTHPGTLMLEAQFESILDFLGLVREMKHEGRSIPGYDELSSGDRPAGTSWGVFGNDLGTLNLVSPEALVRSRQEVRRGVVFPLNLATTLPDPPDPRPRRPRAPPGAARRRRLGRLLRRLLPAGLEPVGRARPRADTRARASTRATTRAVTDPNHPVLGIEQWAARGIAGRFVLADVAGPPGSAGTPLDPATSYAITADLLDEVLAAQGSVMRPGDVLLLHTGWIAWYRGAADRGLAVAKDRRGDPSPRPVWTRRRVPPNGCGTTSSPPWPRTVRRSNGCPSTSRTRTGFCICGSSPSSASPSGSSSTWRLSPLTARQDGRYVGLFVAAPLNTPGGAGSPANALALK